VNKYLHTVASGWIFLSTLAVYIIVSMMHGHTKANNIKYQIFHIFSDLKGKHHISRPQEVFSPNKKSP